MIDNIFLVFGCSFLFTFVAVPWFIPRLMKVGIFGKDMNKETRIEVPEMGGFAVIAGFLVGVLLAIALSSFGVFDIKMDFAVLFAALAVVLVMGLIGVIDDLLKVDQKVKAVLPLFAALPLVAVKVGETSMVIPFFGSVNFGILFPLLLVPLAITGASNATNMLAGFNGLEAGLGAIMCSTIGFVAVSLGKSEAAVLSFAMFGALLAFLRYNWFPAKILIGDVGTLSIGAVVAVSVIVGNIEKAGIILIAPFFLELFLKARGKMKEQSWCDVKGDKLFCCDKRKIFGIGRLFMYLYGGVTEVRLVLSVFVVEFIFSFLVIYSYFGPRIF